MSTIIKNKPLLQISSGPSHVEFGKGNILIISDVSNNQLLLKTYLASVGHEIVILRSDQNIPKVVFEHQIDVIIVDMPLHRQNGFQICNSIKMNPMTQLIPVILLMEFFSEKEATQGYNAGADDFLNKPINQMELLARVRSLIRIKKLYNALEDKIIELKETQNKLKELVVRDELSGAFNYRFFRKQLHHEVARSIRFKYPVSLIILDIDNFKKYNDSYGHPQGDKIIERFATLLMKNIRKVDTLSRYGGDEFALILPGTNRDFALSVAEKLRSIIEYAYFPCIGKAQQGITFSAGVACFPSDANDPEELLQLSDIALYIAKEKGKNKTVTIDSVHDSI